MDIHSVIKNIDDTEVIMYCNEIFDWKDTGTLPQDSQLRALSVKSGYLIRDLENAILDEASDRFRKLTVLTMTERPYKIFNLSRKRSQHKYATIKNREGV